LVISVRGIGLDPTTGARVGLGVTGRMKAALGFRVDFLFVFRAAVFVDFRAELLADFFAMSSPSKA
jgi:hypothetical protein